MDFLIFTVMATAFAMANRFVGSAQWKRELGKINEMFSSRSVAYVGMFAVILVVATIYGSGFIEAVIISSLLSVWLVISRQQSPRGVFFAATGGRPGYESADGMVYFSSDHNPVSKFLAEHISGTDVESAIITHDERALFFYGIVYGFVHTTWVYLLCCIFLVPLVYSFAWVFTPLCALFALPYWIMGAKGPRKTEVRAIEYAELLCGIIPFAAVTFLNIRGAIEHGGLFF